MPITIVLQFQAELQCILGGCGNASIDLAFELGDIFVLLVIFETECRQLLHEFFFGFCLFGEDLFELCDFLLIEGLDGLVPFLDEEYFPLKGA